jgi:hypothetical protein
MNSLEKNQSPVEPHLVAVIGKAPDVDIHIRTLHISGAQVVELRDYIPSLSEYGRGYWIPSSGVELRAIINALAQIDNGTAG